VKEATRASRGGRAWPRRVARLSLLAGMSMGLLALQFPLRTLISEQRAIERAQGQLAALHKENAALEAEIAQLQDPRYLGLVARRDLKLVPQGATLLEVVGPGRQDLLDTLPTRVTPAGAVYGDPPAKRDRHSGRPGFLGRFVEALEFWR
jgi:cell division protein FtsB